MRTRGETFCAACYRDFVARKTRPQLTQLRVSGVPGSTEPPLVVAGVAYTPAALALVCVLADLRDAQIQKHGAAGFRLVCVHVEDAEPLSAPAWPFPDVDLENLSLEARAGAADEQDPAPGVPALDRSTAHDVRAIRVRRRVLAYARSHDAFVAYAFTTTRLAELTLAETVKGRGAAVPELVAPSKESRVLYPLRDLNDEEARHFCDMNGLTPYVRAQELPPRVTTRQSIDEIVHEYFGSVQQEFPGVVATVAKVASRLANPREPCSLCADAPAARSLCYACSRIPNAEALARELNEE